MEQGSTSLNPNGSIPASPEKILGNNYEAHIGQLLENQGFNVLYTGFNFGTRDNMIDLVALNEKHVILAQCKYHKIGLTTDSIDKTAFGAKAYREWITECFQNYEIYEMLASYSFETRLYCSHAQTDYIVEYARAKGICILTEYINPVAERATYNTNDLKYAEIIALDDFSYMEKIKSHLFDAFLNILPTRETILRHDLNLKKGLCGSLKITNQNVEGFRRRISLLEKNVSSLQAQLSEAKSDIRAMQASREHSTKQFVSSDDSGCGSCILIIVIIGIMFCIFNEPVNSAIKEMLNNWLSS